MTESTNDLPLFAWTPPTAVLIPFPLKRDVGRVRRVAAAVLKRTSPEAQQGEFNRQSDAIIRKLRYHGLPEEQIKAQVEEFTRAVNNELHRRQMMQRQPGGAA